MIGEFLYAFSRYLLPYLIGGLFPIIASVKDFVQSGFYALPILKFFVNKRNIVC